MPAVRSDPWQHPEPPRGSSQVVSSRSYEGRFGRLFRELPGAKFGSAGLASLARSMLAPDKDLPLGTYDPDENPAIPAGYTYFGQFITHDLTFDPTTLLDRQNDPAGLVDFRTPRFDLDSLYGRGPSAQPYLYGPRGSLLVGNSVSQKNQCAGPDLPRTGNGLAIIGDPRNDENKVVSQLHSLFIRFHNFVVGRTGDFDEAQRLVRWQYQWLVLNDFLPRFVPQPLIDRILVPDLFDFPTGGAPIRMTGYKPQFRYYKPRKEAFLPVEFSAAAFRFGHSMVRGSYLISDDVAPPAGRNRLPLFAADGQDLSASGPLPPEWGVQWGYFFPIRAGQKYPQLSYLLDETLSDPLGSLPSSVVSDPPPSLPERTLRRGMLLELPSGQDVARLLGVPPIPDADLFADNGLRAAFRSSAPLWYYILREAKLVAGGQQLGPVGATIVAEVIIGLLWSDAQSYLRRQPTWTPQFGNTLGELVRRIGAPI